MAGGMGVAPLSFLCQKPSKAIYFLSCISSTAPVNLPIAFHFTFEEDSRVHFFHHSDYLRRTLSRSYPVLLPKSEAFENFTQAYSCGPTLMMKNFSEWCTSNGLPLQVSLEKHMACGMGSCFGCSIQTRQGMQSVCHDGPVFDHQDILWDQV
jgi:dihydroorotate dehydrogenase electron transfer subunit